MELNVVVANELKYVPISIQLLSINPSNKQEKLIFQSKNLVNIYSGGYLGKEFQTTKVQINPNEQLYAYVPEFELFEQIDLEPDSVFLDVSVWDDEYPYILTTYDTIRSRID